MEEPRVASEPSPAGAPEGAAPSTSAADGAAATSPAAGAAPPSPAAKPSDPAAFDAAWKRFMVENGLDASPAIFNRKPMDLCMLFRLVVHGGGHRHVTKLKLWARVGRAFNPPSSMTDLSFQVKKIYASKLAAFEQAYENGEIGYSVPVATGPDDPAAEIEAAARAAPQAVGKRKRAGAGAAGGAGGAGGPCGPGGAAGAGAGGAGGPGAGGAGGAGAGGGGFPGAPYGGVHGVGPGGVISSGVYGANMAPTGTLALAARLAASGASAAPSPPPAAAGSARAWGASPRAQAAERAAGAPAMAGAPHGALWPPPLAPLGADGQPLPIPPAATVAPRRSDPSQDLLPTSTQVFASADGSPTYEIFTSFPGAAPDEISVRCWPGGHVVLRSLPSASGHAGVEENLVLPLPPGTALDASSASAMLTASGRLYVQVNVIEAK